MVFNINTRIKRAGLKQQAVGVTKDEQPSVPNSQAHRVRTQSPIYNLGSSPHNSAHAFTMAPPCEPRVRLARWQFDKGTIVSDCKHNKTRNSGSQDNWLPGFLETTKRELSSLDGRSTVPYILARFARSERQMLTPSPILGCAQGTKHTEHNQEHHNIRTYNQHNQHNDPALYWQGMYCIDGARVDVWRGVVVATNGQSFLNFQIEKLKNSWRQERYETNGRKEV